MFNINIYTKYFVQQIIDDCYKTYDSCADDWFANENYSKQYEIDGYSLIQMLAQKLALSNFSDFQIDMNDDDLRLAINTFDPMDGTGTEFIYIIKDIGEVVSNNEQ